MNASDKPIGKTISLNTLVASGKAGIITSHYGSILEANAEAAELFNVSSAGAMRNLLLVSYVHRASVNKFRESLNQLRTEKAFSSNGEIRFRARGGKGEFQGLIKSRVLAATNLISILVWEISDAGSIRMPLQKVSGIK